MGAPLRENCVLAFEYIFTGGIASAYQPPSTPVLALDRPNNVLYIASNPTPTTPSVWVAVGGGVNGGPVIQAALQAINTTVPQTVTIKALTTVMYAVSISLESVGNAASGHTVLATLSWTSPTGTGIAHTIDLTLPLDDQQLVMETYPILTLANTSITMATSYSGGAVNDPYTVSIRLVQMPGGN